MRIAMMAMTVRSSMSVKPAGFLEGFMWVFYRGYAPGASAEGAGGEKSGGGANFRIIKGGIFGA